MPKEYFSVDRCVSLSTLAPGARIHVIGVSGVAMAELSMALARAGYVVSGSDKDFWEPMGSRLRASTVTLCHGYDGAHVPNNVDLVVIGNAVSYGNPEVAVVETRGLPYTCFPKILAELAIAGRHSIVVTGTHGKTTTTALTAWILTDAGEKPSYFIGGAAPNFAESFRAGVGQWSVVEGDEYDSAFFAKVPKFTFYRPDTCIVNAIEFDHADIYPDLAAIEREFTKLVTGLPAQGLALCALDFPVIERLLPEWRQASKAKILTFGEHALSDIRIVDRVTKPGGLQRIRCAVGSEVARLYPEIDLSDFELSVPMVGAYNARNAVAAFLATTLRGLSPAAATRAIARFERVRRRQEVRFEGSGFTIIEDFAHHPTAVAQTLAALKEAYPGRPLWAVFEPRSNTSRRMVFRDDYLAAFAQASRVTLAQVEARSIDAGQNLLDVGELAQALVARGVSAETLPNADAIRAKLTAELKPGTVVVIMSNGSFGGLIDALVTHFRAACAAEVIPSVAGLRQAARDIIAVAGDSPDLVAQLVAYEALLDRIDLANLNPEERELVPEILDLHGQVLAKAEVLRGHLAEELRNLRSKGKGLLAYADSMVAKGGRTKKRST